MMSIGNDPSANPPLAQDVPQSLSVEATQPFIHAHIEQLSQHTVAELHARFQAKQQALLDAAFALAAETLAQKNMTAESFDPKCNVTLRDAATHYALACARTRYKISAVQLAHEISLGVTSLMEEAEELLETQNELEKNVQNRITVLQAAGHLQTLQKPQNPALISWTTRLKERLRYHCKQTLLSLRASCFNFYQGTSPHPLPAALATLPWDNKDRIYFRLNDTSHSPIEATVTAHLAAQGYTVTDYAGNRATDNRKNARKIGKLLKDHPGLYEAFIEDPTRNARDLLVVITRNVNDIARGSIDRGWQSCRTNANSAAYTATNEANIGVMSAYLISADDPDIHNPLARINIKPYDRIIKENGYATATVDKNDTIYAPFNPIGLHNAGFVDAIYRFVDTLNANKVGHYHLRQECEAYREYRKRYVLPKDAATALKYLGVGHSKNKKGEITVNGDLRINDKGLMRLPDFSNVTVNGHVDFSGNRLLTLEGMPQNGVHSLTVQRNLLLCFAGAAAAVKTVFDYRNNAWLISTHGAPRANSYAYGNSRNGDDRDSNYATGPVAIGPIEEAARFPGFKR